jgi:hypothetical protein
MNFSFFICAYFGAAVTFCAGASAGNGKVACAVFDATDELPAASRVIM